MIDDTLPSSRVVTLGGYGHAATDRFVEEVIAFVRGSGRRTEDRPFPPASIRR